MLARSPSRLAGLALLLVASLTLTACPEGRGRSGGATDGSSGETASTAEPETSPQGEGDGQPGRTRGAERGEAAESNSALVEQYGDALDLPMVTYRWNKDAGDPSVSAQDGGPGFTGEGWETRMTFPALGWADAPRGGSIKQHLLDWPATLRLQGKNYNTAFNYAVIDLAAESLLGTHPVDLEPIPSVATHWKISDDGQTYTFRINPEARFSDGTELTAEDVVANWKFRMDPSLLLPSNLVVWSKFEEPVAKSKYIVEVTAKVPNWRNFIYFRGMPLYPSEAIADGGTAYLERYQNAYHALSGAYEVRMEDVNVGKSIAISRRDDWWREGDPSVAGTANVDRFEFEIVKDPNLAFEKAKKGELDLFYVGKAQWWAEEIPELESVQRGLLQMRKIYNDKPIGTSGIAINMGKKPLDELPLRKALQLLYNRPLMIEKLYFNEYEPLNSYWQGGSYQNPDNEEFPYDPFAAVELLEGAGWTEIDDQGYRVRDGKRLSFEIVYRSPLSERNLTQYQEDARRAGIELKIRLTTPAEHWKAMQAKEYQLSSMAWGALVFPNPETSYKGELAEKVDNNNITAFADPRVDELLVAYDQASTQRERERIMQKIDGIIYHQHPYVLGWYGPSVRFIHWNKIGMPPWGCSRRADSSEYWYSFWVDPEKEAQLEAAREDPSISMEREPVHNRFWKAFAERERLQSR